MIKSALRRFKCLGSLNSVENVGNRVGSFGKFSQNTLQLLARSREATHKGLEKRLFARARIYTQYTVLFYHLQSAIRGAQIRRCTDFGVSCWADLSVGVQTAARAPFCPLFAGIHR